MCLPKPGPRCSLHTRQRLNKAKARLEHDPNNEVLQNAVASAQEEYDASPDGIYELRQAGKNDEADAAQDRRNQQVLAYKEVEEAKNRSFREKAASFVPDCVARIKEQWQVWVDRAHASYWEKDPAKLAELAEHSDWKVRGAVARNDAASPETLAQLANDENVNVRQAVAINKDTPADALAALARDDNRDVRGAVAANRNTSVRTLAEVLSNDPDSRVRDGLAHNPNTPVEVLREIAKNPTPNQQLGLAGNHSTPPGILENLYVHYSEYPDKDKDPKGFAQAEAINERLAYNGSTPPGTLHNLATHSPNRATREVAQFTQKELKLAAKQEAKAAKAAETEAKAAARAAQKPAPTTRSASVKAASRREAFAAMEAQRRADQRAMREKADGVKQPQMPTLKGNAPANPNPQFPTLKGDASAPTPVFPTLKGNAPAPTPRVPDVLRKQTPAPQTPTPEPVLPAHLSSTGQARTMSGKPAEEKSAAKPASAPFIPPLPPLPSR